MQGEVGVEKAELHVHLEGSIEAETLMAIDPSVSRAEIDANLHGRTFEEFLRGYIWVVNRLADSGALCDRDARFAR